MTDATPRAQYLLTVNDDFTLSTTAITDPAQPPGTTGKRITCLPTDPHESVAPLFPWITEQFSGPTFDNLPTTLKDAISWFFEHAQWENAAIVTAAEAPTHENATNDTRGQRTPPGISQEYSCGSWQINLLAHPTVQEEQARDNWWSTEYAAGLYKENGDWSSWAYTAKAHGLPQHVLLP